MSELAQDRYVQVGWWNEREGHMMPLHCAGPKAGFTPLYKREWPLDLDHEADNAQGVWCCDFHRERHRSRSALVPGAL